jgi:hypothetical protein
MSVVCSAFMQSGNRKREGPAQRQQRRCTGPYIRLKILEFPDVGSEQIFLVVTLFSAQCGRNRGDERADQQ